MPAPHPSAKAPRAQRPYCLFCYAPMPRGHEASAVCARCGAQNLRVDQEIFWTREGWLRRLELAAKVLIGGFVGWIGYELLFSFDGGFGMGQGFAVGAPILIGVVLWDTVSKLTRRNPYFNAGLFWSVLPIVIGVPLLALGLGGLVKVVQGWSDGPRQQSELWAVVFVLLCAALLLGLALGSRLFGRRLRAWQERRVLQAQERMLAEGAGAGSPQRP